MPPVAVPAVATTTVRASAAARPSAAVSVASGPPSASSRSTDSVSVCAVGMPEPLAQGPLAFCGAWVQRTRTSWPRPLVSPVTAWDAAVPVCPASVQEDAPSRRYSTS